MGNTCSGSSGKNVVVTGKSDIGEIQFPHGATSKANANVPTPSSDVGSSPKRPRSSRVSGVRTSSIAPVVQNSQPSVPSCSGNDYANGTQEVDNVSSNYKWDANVFVAHHVTNSCRRLSGA